MNLRKWILLSALLITVVGCEQRFSSGDRVLVSKCSYDLGITAPKRYEVVVFKYPDKPMDNNTPKNYIKRLLGLPGELIAIFFGRLYHRVPEPNGAPFYDDLKDGVTQANNLWLKRHMHVDEPDDEKALKDGKFTILRKPPSVLLALRRNVYDNDFQAKDLVGKLDRWRPAASSAWKNDKATGFFTESRPAETVDWMRYQHLVRPDGPLAGGAEVKPMLILDTLDYNALQTNSEHGNIVTSIYNQAHWVGDLMLECNLEVTEPKGEFWFELSKGIDRFRACFDLASGECTLYREGPDKTPVKLDQKPTRVKGAGSYLLRFANIDARLTVWVDRDLPFKEGFEYDPPEVNGPKENLDEKQLLERRGPTKNDLQPASVGTKAAAVKVTQLRLWRDIYYRTRIDGPGTDYESKAQHDWPARDDWVREELFREFRKQRCTTMYVQPGHYLCLGDNSQSSSDSRVWGLVPERLMLGRAMVVYFPLERMGAIR